MSRFTLSRRTFAKAAGAAALASALPMPFVKTASAATELIHWSWLAASDGEVWAQMIQAFNDAHKDKGVQIKMEVVAEDQYNTKILAAAASGQAPDFGWGTAGDLDLCRGRGQQCETECESQEALHPVTFLLFFVPRNLFAMAQWGGRLRWRRDRRRALVAKH